MRSVKLKFLLTSLSVRNAIRSLGFEVEDITTAESIEVAKVLVFPGVGSFGSAIDNLDKKGLTAALRAYVTAGRPFFGICLGMQTLFEGSEESPGIPVSEFCHG